MPYKVLTKTVTASGNITNTQANYGNTVGDGPASFIRVGWSAAILGQLIVEGSAYVGLNYAEAIAASGPPYIDLPILPYFYGQGQVSASVPGEQQSNPAPDTPPDPATNAPNTAASLPDGSYSLSAPLTLWAEFGLDIPEDTGNNAPAYGVFQGPPMAHLRLYWTLTEGGTCSAHASWGGASADASFVVSAVQASQEVAYNASLSATADYGIHQGEQFLLQVPGEAGVSVTMDYSGGTLPGTLAYSNPVGRASTAGGSVQAIAIIPSSEEEDGGSAIYNGHSVKASLSGSPDKVFAISGVCKSVGDAYPGSVEMSCSKFVSDPSPDFTAGGSFGISGTQQDFSEVASVSTYGAGYDYDNVGNDNAVHRGQALSIGFQGDWLDGAGEYVVYTASDDANNTAPRKFYNDLVFLHGWNFGGVSLSQEPTIPVNPCTSATGWSGAALATGGGLKNSGTGPMILNFATGFDFWGYRYLRLHNAFASSASTVTLSLGGRTWTKPVTATPTDIEFDLCDPTTGGADTDTYDTKWPTDSANRNVGNGLLSGVSVAESLSLSVPNGVTLTVKGIEQFRKTAPEAYFLSEWAPRADQDQPMEVPPVSSGTGGDAILTTAYAHRGLVCDTDGKSSLEYRDIYTAHQESDNMSSWSQRCWSISEMVDYINTNASAGTGTCGWSATAVAPENDESSNLHNGGLNQDTEGTACWTCYGWKYLGGSGGWSHTIGAGLYAPCQLLVTSIAWPPGIGDVFGLGPGGSGNDNTLYLGASWVTRAQARGLLLSDQGGTAGGQQVTLTPASGEIQPAGVPVGWGNSARPEGDFRTGGPGLVGYTTAGTAPGLSTSGSQGVVAALGRTVTQTFQTRRLSHVAIRGPLTSSCCDGLFFQDPALHDPLPVLPGDADAMPVEEWKRID